MHILYYRVVSTGYNRLATTPAVEGGKQRTQMYNHASTAYSIAMSRQPQKIWLRKPALGHRYVSEPQIVLYKIQHCSCLLYLSI